MRNEKHETKNCLLPCCATHPKNLNLKLLVYQIGQKGAIA